MNRERTRRFFQHPLTTGALAGGITAAGTELFFSSLIEAEKKNPSPDKPAFVAFFGFMAFLAGALTKWEANRNNRMLGQSKPHRRSS